jgi:hypothetical protein
VRPDGALVVSGGFVGTAHHDGLFDVAVDAAGRAYAVGETRGHTAGRTDADVMLVRITATGESWDYFAGWGGSRDDSGRAVAVDPDGMAYVTGQTSSPDYPSLPGIPLRGALDAFVTRVDPRQNRLTYSRYIGGDARDGGTGIALDTARNAYVVGFTQSTPSQGFPLLGGPSLTYAGVVDGFLVTMRPAGDGLVFGTYVESNTGNAGSQITDIAVDPSGNAYLAGVGVEAFDVQSLQGARQGVVVKIGEPSNQALSPPQTVCTPRPAVAVTTARTATGQLLVTIKAGTSAGKPTNTIRELRFSETRNAMLDIPQGPVGLTGAYIQALTARPTQTTLVVRRATNGSFTVPLEVVDDCVGTWKTFVGGGTSLP